MKDLPLMALALSKVTLRGVIRSKSPIKIIKTPEWVNKEACDHIQNPTNDQGLPISMCLFMLTSFLYVCLSVCLSYLKNQNRHEDFFCDGLYLYCVFLLLP